MKGSFSSIVLRRIFPVSGINKSFDASAYYKIIQKEQYLFPDLSCDEGWVDHYHIECLMQVCWDIFGLIEIIEHIAWVFIELLIKLYKQINSRTKSLHQILWRYLGFLYSLESNRWKELRERRCVSHRAHTHSP
jgi:hypothetical protein